MEASAAGSSSRRAGRARIASHSAAPHRHGERASSSGAAAIAAAEPPDASQLPWTVMLPTSQTERSSGRSAARRRRSLRVGGAGAEVI